MTSVSTVATMAAAMAIQKQVANAASVGIAWPPCSTLMAASTPPMTADALDVPTERNSALSPFETPVSCDGTDCMMIIGIAANENAMPTPMMQFATTMCQTSLDSSSTKT